MYWAGVWEAWKYCVITYINVCVCGGGGGGGGGGSNEIHNLILCLSKSH